MDKEGMVCVCTHTYINIYIYTQYVYIHTEILVIKKNEVLPFTTIWMNLDDIMLSDISQAKRQILYDFTYMCNLKKKKNRNRVMDTENKLVFPRVERNG